MWMPCSDPSLRGLMNCCSQPGLAGGAQGEGPLLGVRGLCGRSVAKTSHLPGTALLAWSLPPNQLTSFSLSIKGSKDQIRAVIWHSPALSSLLQESALANLTEFSHGALRSQRTKRGCAQATAGGPATAHGSPARTRPSVAEYFCGNWKSVFSYVKSRIFKYSFRFF